MLRCTHVWNVMAEEERRKEPINVLLQDCVAGVEYSKTLSAVVELKLRLGTSPIFLSLYLRCSEKNSLENRCSWF